jgi:hypothetical protein
MRRIISAALSLGAILALSVVFAGGAQAHTFLATGALPALLLILSDGPQTFTAIPNGASVVCRHARFHGKVEKEAQLTQIVVGEYSKCEAFGFPASVSPAEYELSADETVSVINKNIVIKVAAAGCEIEIGPSNNKGLGKIRYLVDPQASTRLLAHVEVQNIHSTIKGGGGITCGAEGAHTEGRYLGLVLAWLDSGGTLSWS